MALCNFHAFVSLNFALVYPIPQLSYYTLYTHLLIPYFPLTSTPFCFMLHIFYFCLFSTRSPSGHSLPCQGTLFLISIAYTNLHTHWAKMRRYTHKLKSRSQLGGYSNYTLGTHIHINRAPEQSFLLTRKRFQMQLMQISNHSSVKNFLFVVQSRAK